MKNLKHVLFSFAFILSAIFSKAQAPANWYSPEMLFDTTITDGLGHRYSLNDIKVDTVTADGSGSKTTLATCSGTTAGYFDLYLQPGCGFEPIPGNPTQSAINAQRLSVLCQVFIDLSSFVTNRGGNSNRVRIWVRECTPLIPSPSTSGVAGVGASFYSYPYSTTKNGIIDNEIWKTINSGQDSYKGITSPLITTGPGFYHGQITFNFYNSLINWHTNLSTITTSTLVDLYTIALHEATHAFGFLSALTANGNSLINGGLNNFTRYDQFLKSSSGTFLVANTGACSMYNFGFNTSTTAINPNTSNCITDVTTCSLGVIYSSSSQNIPVYTPNCFELYSSLSHFEDMCHPTNTPTNNNQYFVMSNMNSNGQMKRYLKEEERKVLCDLGYTVAATYGTPTYTTTQKTYTAGLCNGLSVIGINDGLGTGGNYTYTSTVGANTLVISPQTNDINATAFECLEVVSGSGTPSGTSGTSFNYNPSTVGIHLLRYIPKNGSIKGNITYIYVKVINTTSNCATPNNCEMVYNGGFESASTTCGWSGYSTASNPGPLVNCWNITSSSFRYYVRNCTTNSSINSNSAYAFSIPGVGESWNGSPGNNNAYIYTYPHSTPNRFVYEGNLATNLTPSGVYKLSFWARSADPTPNIVPDPVLNVSAASSPVAGPVSATSLVPSPFVSIATVTVPMDGLWHNFSQTFTYTGASSAPYLYLMTLYSGTGILHDLNIDDISILPASAACSFTLPPYACTGSSFTLNPMVSVPNGTFTGPGVSLTGGNYVFNTGPAGLGLKTILYTYTTVTGCTLTAIAQTSVTQTPTAITVFANPPAGLCSSYPTATLSAIGANTFSWNPGALTGSTVSVSPTSTTIYTVVGANGTCSLSTTFTVSYSASCVCTAANALPSSVSNTILNASEYSLTNNMTVTSGTVTLASPDIRCSAGSSITVASGATLIVSQSHFYSCFDMWNGIVVQPGGYLSITGSLVEDAITGVDVSNNTSTSGKIIDIVGTTFNKDYTGISISNYTQTAQTTYTTFSVKSSLFTCRTLTFTSSSWPSTSALISTCTPVTNLNTPYCVQNTSFCNLKSPYSTESAQTGISLNTVGVTSTPSTTPTYYSIQIGDHTVSGNLNLFDNLFYGIYAVDANLKSMNNAFQNSQYKFVHGTYFGGVGIEHRTEWTEPNTYLLTKAPAPYTLTRNNKFYDCTYAVRTNNIFEVNASNMLIQSTQTTSSFYQRGKYGIYMTTDRYKAYDASSSSIYNVENPIVFSTTYGQVNFGASSYTNTQYSGTVNINYNTIAPVPSGGVGSAFVSNAITAQNLLSTGSTFTALSGAQINASGNVLRYVYRGIYGANFSTPPFMSAGNTCTLLLDPGGNLQTGITIDACTNASVQTNNILGPGTSNTITTGIYSSICGAPKVTCNTVSATYQGFEFSGSNSGAKWKGNSMTTHTIGLALTNTAVIGTQGSASNPIDNSWNGTWAGPPYCTYNSANSFATSSPLWVKNSAPYLPTSFNSAIFGQDYGTGGLNTTTGAYSCAGGGARYSNSDPDSVQVSGLTKGTNNSSNGSRTITDDQDYEQSYIKTLEDIAGYNITKNNVFEPANYIAQYQVYKTIDNDVAYYQSNKTLSDFYTNNKNSGYGKLLDGENDLKNGNYSSAISAVSSISSKNNIESNYNDFYNLYSKYYAKSFVDLDNKSLFTLANKCPFTEGEVIYQARALYNVINSTVELFKDNCPDKSSSRLKNTFEPMTNWNVNIYPNPATNELFISTNNDKEDIKIIITDVNGRIVGDYNVKTNGFNSNIKLNMNSGIYFVTLSNNTHKVIKKLVITK